MADPARDLRYARWLVERAAESVKVLSADLFLIKRSLERLGGSYRDDEPGLFAQVTADADQQLDLWADLKASDR